MPPVPPVPNPEVPLDTLRGYLVTLPNLLVVTTAAIPMVPPFVQDALRELNNIIDAQLLLTTMSLSCHVGDKPLRDLTLSLLNGLNSGASLKTALYSACDQLKIPHPQSVFSNPSPSTPGWTVTVTFNGAHSYSVTRLATNKTSAEFLALTELLNQLH